MVKATRPPSMRTSRTKPKETMSRERPGKRTFFSASITSSLLIWGEGIPFLLFEPLERRADDGDRLFRGSDDLDDVQVGRTDQSPLDHHRADPVDQTGPHCTDQDHRMLLHVLDLQQLP